MDNFRDESATRQDDWADRIDVESASRLLAALDEETAEALAEVDEALGESFPGYRLERLIGQGGGGSVYCGYRDGSDRPVAIKSLRTPFARGERAERAWRELQILSQLRLPSVPAVMDYGIANDRLFVVTDYVEGLNLAEHCEVRRLALAQRVELLARTADAVQNLHEHGVIHRDLKPSNILVNPHGQPMIIDLGIASMLAADVTETLVDEGVPIGSPAFMSPEQAEGRRAEISTRSDVYGLGSTAYVILTGEPPHDMAETIGESVRRVSQEPPRDPRAIRPSLPSDLAAILRKAVARQPGDRYAGARDFAADLRRWLGGEPVSAQPPTAWSRLVTWVRKHPLYATAALCALILLTTIAATFISVHFLNARPHTIVLSEDRSSVRLVARSGNILHEWNTGRRGGVLCAHLFRAGSSAGELRIAIGFENSGDLWAGRLCIFRADQPHAPVWSSIACDPLVATPQGIGEMSGQNLHLMTARAIDIFEDPPGLEILALYYHSPHSPSCLRVHAADGAVLAEMWHWGRLYDVGYDPQSGTLVVAGVNSETIWSERTLEQYHPAHPHPVVAFALHRDQLRRGAWIHREGADGAVRPLWYRALLPPISAGVFQSRVAVHIYAPESGRALRFGSVGLRVQSPATRAGLEWPVSPAGEFGEPVIMDSYRAALDQPDSNLPDPSVFHWTDLPSLLEANHSR